MTNIVKPKTRIIQGHNFHRFLMDFENALNDGYVMNRRIAAKRSLGQRFTVAMMLNEAEKVEDVKVEVDKSTAAKTATKTTAAKATANKTAAKGE